MAAISLGLFFLKAGRDVQGTTTDFHFLHTDIFLMENEVRLAFRAVEAEDEGETERG